LVAPAYPRAAKEQRIQGTALVFIAINRDGIVTEAKLVSAHPVFGDYVLAALKQWRFKASNQAHTLQVTCVFEFITDKCEGTDKHPVISETQISAELPAVVHVRTGLQCIETSTP
jgi:TonB family protein